jgi:hypothetical protein
VCPGNTHRALNLISRHRELTPSAPWTASQEKRRTIVDGNFGDTLRYRIEKFRLSMPG